MKYLFTALFSVFMIHSFCATADPQKGEKEKKRKANEIQWMTLEEAERSMKNEPRKVYMDIYTDWCGWCKVMDKKTFSHPEVIKYINDNFYAIKLDAEDRDSLQFLGKKYGFSPQHRANMLAVQLLNGRMSFPTSVILEENFQNPTAIPGYLDVTMMEKVLKYMGEDIYKTKQFPAFEKEFTASWSPDKK